MTWTLVDDGVMLEVGEVSAKTLDEARPLLQAIGETWEEMDGGAGGFWTATMVIVDEGGRRYPLYGVEGA